MSDPSQDEYGTLERETSRALVSFFLRGAREFYSSTEPSEAELETFDHSTEVLIAIDAQGWDTANKHLSILRHLVDNLTVVPGNASKALLDLTEALLLESPEDQGTADEPPISLRALSLSALQTWACLFVGTRAGVPLPLTLLADDQLARTTGRLSSRDIALENFKQLRRKWRESRRTSVGHPQPEDPMRPPDSDKG